MQAYQKRGLPLAPGMEIGYVVTDAAKWKVDTEKDASDFDTGGAVGEGLGRGRLRAQECLLHAK